ncbi:L,D-transpeptidase family protein [Tessaracoccus sp.]
MPLLLSRRLVLVVVVLLGISGCAPGPTTNPSGTTPPSVAVPAPTDSAPVTEPTPPEPTPTSESTPTSDVTEPVTTTTPSVVVSPGAILSPGDVGDGVRELQHRLLQLDWYSGSITEDFNEQTQLAVEGFQAKRGLPVLGFVDKATWDTLVGMSRVPTDDEMHNILRPGPALLAAGATGDSVKDLQARLKQIAWYSPPVDGVYGPQTVAAVEGFQGKREIPVTGEVDQRTLDRLAIMTRRPTTDELNNVAPKPKSKTMKLDDRCLKGRVVCISKAQRKLAWVIDGEIQLTMDVRFGSELNPTRNGAFSVNWKSKNHVSSLYHTAMPYALFFSGGQAVHFSADFKARGYNGSSHGCVNVRDKKAVSSLFDATQAGDKVIVYAG